MKRRKFLFQTSVGTASILLSNQLLGKSVDFPTVRIPLSKRKFNSKAVEKIIEDVKGSIGNKKIAWLFENCFPNTLDTTVFIDKENNKPFTYVITGDIDAMWLRDSAAQVTPYIPLAKKDKALNELLQGVINMQTKCILRDPYANAFFKSELDKGGWVNDKTLMKPGVHERKWEIDSLCYPIRLSYLYWKETKEIGVFDESWLEAMQLIIKTFKEQQRLENNGPYSFQRETSSATDTLPLDGYGYPTNKIGLIHSMFRPSDDATIFPFLIPSNMFAAEVLDNLSEMLTTIHKRYDIANTAKALSENLIHLINKHGVVEHPKYGNIYAYEINGFGSSNLMDDANVPNLLSIPYLTNKFDNNIYNNTRKFVLSIDNPFYFEGKDAYGNGGPHSGMNMIWPLGLIMRALTATNKAEIKDMLYLLQLSTADTGFMHESFHKDNVQQYTRSWFAWANTLYGELIIKIKKEHPDLLA